MVNLFPLVFVAFCACVGALLGSALVGATVGLGVVVLANLGR